MSFFTPIEEKDKWLAFDFEKSIAPEEYWGMLNIRVANENCGGNSERTEITFDTQGQGGNEMHLRAEVHGYKGPSTHDTETGLVTITLYGQAEAESFFEAMRRMVQAYDLRTKIGD